MNSMLHLAIYFGLALVPVVLVAYGIRSWIALKGQHVLAKSYRNFEELPADLVPAIAGHLLNGCSVGVLELVATIFDLAQRGFIKIEKVSSPDHGLLSIAATDYILKRTFPADLKALPFEIDMMDFVFADIGDARQVKISEITKFGFGHPQKLADFMQGWRQSVAIEADKHHFVDEQKLALASLSGNAGYGMLGVGIAFFSLGYGTAVVPLGVGASMLACMFSVKKSCCRGSYQFKQWQDFKNFLLHLRTHSAKIPTSMPIWEHYLAYANAFGISHEVLHELNILIPAEVRNCYKGPEWFTYPGHTRGFEALKTIYIDIADQLRRGLDPAYGS